MQAGLPKAAVIFCTWKKNDTIQTLKEFKNFYSFLLYIFNQINIFRISKYNPLKLLTAKDRIRCVIKIPFQILTYTSINYNAIGKSINTYL